jgi:UDP-N-acetylmuramoyl-tripeptide--D-alanyl-D-alanine ligase
MTTGECLWTWDAICMAVGAPPVAGPQVNGISIDTRTLNRGDLFVALAGDPGPRFQTHNRSARDGHDYVADAAVRGAAGALVHRPVGVDLPQLCVADTLDALWALGRAARARLACPVLAVTGSSGKTTVKTFLSAALGCPASVASFNNHLGVPLSLARTPAHSQAAVFEVGTNHPGEIAPLAKLVRPNVALVLNVMGVHLENFPDMGALQREKLSIAAGLEPGGVLILLDSLLPLLPDALPTQLGQRPRVVTFGTSRDADVRLENFDPGRRIAHIRWGAVNIAAVENLNATAEPGETVATVPGGGAHRALSMTATVACIIAGGFDAALARQLDDGVIPAGRGRIHDIAGVSVIDDSYNANPVSMSYALRDLRTMAEAAGGRAFAVLGEMLELGTDSERLHRELARDCAGLTGVWCVGAGARALFDVLSSGQRRGYAEAAGDLDLAAIAGEFGAGDYVLVKGSNRVFWAHQFAPRLLEALSGTKSASR